MNTQTAPQAASRRIGRSILAVLVGIVVGVVLSIATDFGLQAIGLAPKGRWPNNLLTLATAYRSIYGILASYIIARLAPNRPMGHALVAGTLGLIVSTLGAIAAWSTTAGQHWYPIALAVLAIPSVWFGGLLYRKQTEKDEELPVA